MVAQRLLEGCTSLLAVVLVLGIFAGLLAARGGSGRGGRAAALQHVCLWRGRLDS